MYFVCLHLLITALSSAMVGYSLYMRTCSTKGTIPLLVLNPLPQYTAKQRVAGVKKFSKFSESIFDSLPAGGISW